MDLDLADKTTSPARASASAGPWPKRSTAPARTSRCSRAARTSSPGRRTKPAEGGRAGAYPCDVTDPDAIEAAAALYLVSGAASYLTGCAINMDGGVSRVV